MFLSVRRKRERHTDRQRHTERGRDIQNDVSFSFCSPEEGRRAENLGIADKQLV